MKWVTFPTRRVHIVAFMILWNANRQCAAINPRKCGKLCISLPLIGV
jgi:hypothetical protein